MGFFIWNCNFVLTVSIANSFQTSPIYYNRYVRHDDRTKYAKSLLFFRKNGRCSALSFKQGNDIYVQGCSTSNWNQTNRRKKIKGQKRQTTTCLPMHQVVKPRKWVLSVARCILESGELLIRLQHCRAYRSCWYPAPSDHLAAVSSWCCSANYRWN